MLNQWFIRKSNPDKIHYIEQNVRIFAKIEYHYRLDRIDSKTYLHPSLQLAIL